MKAKLYKFLWRRFGHVRSVQHFAGILLPYLNSKCCPPHAFAEITSGDEQKLWANMWEALLYWHFSRISSLVLRNDHIAKSGQDGPDFQLRFASQNIWVEAIVPKPTGIPAEWLEPPVPGNCRAKTKPHDAILLRWTSALKEKRDQFERYRLEGTTSKDDCTVVAVNSCMLSDFAFEDLGVSQLPTAVEAVLPIGPLAVPISSDGKQTGDAIRVPRFEIKNRNNATVATNNFLNPEYANVSALMGSFKRDLVHENLELVVVHNPLAAVPLPQGILGAHKEYSVELNGDYFTLRRV